MDEIISIEKVCDGDTLIAVIVKSVYAPQKDAEFLTDENCTQQVGLLNCPKDKIIQSHIHKPVQRNIVGTSEAIFVRKGLVNVDLYNNEKKHISTKTLAQGDLILLITGGHGFKMLEDSELLEVKQGPYLGVDDKERF